MRQRRDLRITSLSDYTHYWRVLSGQWQCRIVRVDRIDRQPAGYSCLFILTSRLHCRTQAQKQLDKHALMRGLQGLSPHLGKSIIFCVRSSHLTSRIARHPCTMTSTVNHLLRSHGPRGMRCQRWHGRLMRARRLRSKPWSWSSAITAPVDTVSMTVKVVTCVACDASAVMHVYVRTMNLAAATDA